MPDSRGASFVTRQAPRPQPHSGASRSPWGIHVTAQSLGKGPSVFMTGQPFHSGDPPSDCVPPERLPPPSLYSSLPPEKTQASLSGPGSQGGQLASPGGSAREMRSWLQDSPPPPAGPEHSPPFSASPSLPQCDRSAPPAIGVSAIQLRAGHMGQSAHPCSDPSLPRGGRPAPR